MNRRGFSKFDIKIKKYLNPVGKSHIPSTLMGEGLGCGGCRTGFILDNKKKFLYYIVILTYAQVMETLAETIFERTKERRRRRSHSATSRMSDADVAKKRPALSGEAFFGQFLCCSSLMYRSGYTSLLTP